MSMSKKDFIALADVIRSYDKEAAEAGCFEAIFPSGTVLALADFCASQSPRFNRERWLAYIAGEWGPNGGAAKR